MSETRFTGQVCMCYASSNFRRWCNHISLVSPLLKISCSINGCQRQYSVFRSYIRHIKQQHIGFWDAHWNISKETTLSNDIHNNSSIEKQAVDFDSNLQSSLDEISGETFDELEEGAYQEIVTETLSFEDLVLTFLLELRELKKASDVSCEFVARSINSLLEATNMEQKIELDRLLKEFNAESPQEISEHLQQNLSSFASLQKAFEKFFKQKTLDSFVAKQPFFVTASEIKLNAEEISKDHTFHFSMSQYSGQLKFFCQDRMFKSMFFHLVTLKMMG